MDAPYFLITANRRDHRGGLSFCADHVWFDKRPNGTPALWYTTEDGETDSMHTMRIKMVELIVRSKTAEGSDILLPGVRSEPEELEFVRGKERGHHEELEQARDEYYGENRPFRGQ